MNERIRCWSLLCRALLVTLLLSVTSSSLWAQCPTVTFQVDYPLDQSTQSGIVPIHVSMTPLTLPWRWKEILVEIRTASDFIEEQGPAEITGPGTAFREFDLPAAHTSSSYLIRVFPTAENIQTGQTCGYWPTSGSRIYPQWVTTSRRASEEGLHCPCCRDRVPTGSSTSPLTGNQNWSVPIASWSHKGKSFSFGVTYNSHSLIDPQSYDPDNTVDPFAPLTPDLMGLSERNRKWSHPYAQWIDLYKDESGAEYAVWHHGDGHLSFKKEAGGTFTAPETGLTLTYGGTATTTYPCNGASPEPSVQVPYGWFTITTADGTQYQFSQPQPNTGDHLYWVKSNCSAIPLYLLSRIQDRWNRAVDLSWTDVAVGAGMDRRLTAVRDPNGTGLTLGYNGNGLLNSVQDPQGRTHSLAYAAVPDENGRNRQKLSGVTVYGPGSPNRTVHTWSFTYHDPNNATYQNDAYGGTFTGDLIIRKTAPDGLETHYRHEAVGLISLNGEKRRFYADDWEGRMTRASWSDSSEGTQVERVITRSKDSATQATLTYPGGVAVRYNYFASGDVASVTDMSTGRVWSYTYETGKHELTTVRSPLEATGEPLVEYTYVFDSFNRIDKVTARYRKDDGTLGDPVETDFNDLHLPTQIKAFARSGLAADHQVTQFVYDGGTLSVGNLTQIIEAAGTGFQQATGLSYAGTGGSWGLPTGVTNEVGATSVLSYDPTSGLALTASSPENLVVPVGHGDRGASTTTIGYNGDQLPNLVKDPLLHQVAIGYNALAVNSEKLVITTTHAADMSTKQVLLDGAGRVLETLDERGIKTAWTYTPQGQVKTVTRNAGDADPNQRRTTTFSYSDQGDLRWIDPPAGSGGRVQFEYHRYTSSGVLVTPTVYEGQVTRILYADGRSEFFGYNGAGELAWKRKHSGQVITIAARDSQHRVTQTDYPAAGGSSAFSVSAAYDEFGRTVSSGDTNTGTTLLAYDVLNRPTAVTPPSPQKALTFSYTPDTVLQRWTSSMTLAGIGSYTYRADTKGRLSEVVNAHALTFRKEYDKDGKNVLTVWPNGVQEERSYDNRDWLANLLIRQQNGTVKDSFQYLYTDAGGQADPTGRLRREIDSLGQTHAYSYNNRYELDGESHPDLGTVSYVYGKNGSRLSRTQNGVTEYYGVTADNRLIWVNGINQLPNRGQNEPYILFNYTADGQVSRRDRRFTLNGLRQDVDLLWDGDDRLRQVNDHATGSMQFSALYNGDGIRIKKTDTRGALGLQVHDYSYGPGGLLHESNPNTVYTPGFGHRSNGINKFYHVDWIGSTRYTSDSTGNAFPAAMRFDAYGNRSATGGTDPYHSTDVQFAGGWGYQSEWSNGASDPGLGLQYLEQRYYDPAVGRFLSPDPIGFAGGLNLYQYCGNNPVGFVDPNGEFLVATAAGGAVIGGIIGGVSAALQGGDWKAGAFQGAVIGGIMGATGGTAAWAASGIVGSGLAGTAVSGAFGGAVGSAWGQGAQVAFGWRSGVSASEAGWSAAGGAVIGGGIRGWQAWRAARDASRGLVGCKGGSAGSSVNPEGIIPRGAFRGSGDKVWRKAWQRWFKNKMSYEDFKRRAHVLKEDFPANANTAIDKYGDFYLDERGSEQWLGNILNE